LEVPHTPARLRGFSLVKLLLGIAAILVVLGVSVPNYIGARSSIIEAAVAEELRTFIGRKASAWRNPAATVRPSPR